jgi:trigger factor
MNISHESKDAVSGIVKIEIEKKDFEAQVEKSLRQYRQQAHMPGFRKGMAPLAMLRKKYGKLVQIEEVNRLVTENVVKYISDSELQVLGQPIASLNQQPIDFDTQEQFEFTFDIALAPEIRPIKPTRRDKLTCYQVVVDEAMVDKQIDTYRKNLGVYGKVDSPVEAGDLIKGVVAELENSAPKEGGILVENAILMPNYIKDETERAKFIGAGQNDVIVFNPKVAWQGAEAEIASLLKIKKEDAASVTNDFRFEVKEITRYKDAELDQAFFDKLFGEGAVGNETELREKVKELLESQLLPQSKYKFQLDVRALLLKKAGAVQLADDILKRFIIASSEQNTPEKVDEEYPEFAENIKFKLITDRLVKDNNLRVEPEEMESAARQLIQAHFSQYGVLSIQDEVLDKYAKDYLKTKENVESVFASLIERKVADWVKEKTNVETKEITIEEFDKIFA